MASDIRSHHQTGGITAHTVNLNVATAPASAAKPRQRWKKLVIGAAAIVAFIASVTKILDYIGVKPEPSTHSPETQQSKSSPTTVDAKLVEVAKIESQKELMQNLTPNVNVTSYNQSGGITAHTVNLGEPSRRINAQLVAELDRVTPGYKKYKVTCALGDAEAYGLAAEMMSYLKSKGLEVDGVNQAVWMPPLKGLGMRPEGDTLDLQVGSR